MTSSPPKTRIRLMIQKDHPYLIRLESAASDYPVTMDEMLALLKRKTTVSLVVEDDQEKILAACVYSNLPTKTLVHHLIVDPDHQRKGIGTLLLKRLKSKLTGRRKNIELVLRDDNLPGCLFLKSQGFQAKRILKKAYENGSDAYLFVYGEKKSE